MLCSSILHKHKSDAVVPGTTLWQNREQHFHRHERVKYFGVCCFAFAALQEHFVNIVKKPAVFTELVLQCN